MIGHITQTELRHHSSTVELANGFLNRFLLIACRRVRLLPEGGAPDPLRDTPLQQRLARNLTAARHAGQLHLDEAARELWRTAYTRLAELQPGIAGALDARAEAHTIRLALLYTLIAAPPRSRCHLHAALALRDYTSRSARWALDHTTGDPLAHEIHGALEHAAPGGLDAHPATRPLPPQPARRPRRPSTRRATSRRQDLPATRPHRRPARRALDLNARGLPLTPGRRAQRNLTSPSAKRRDAGQEPPDRAERSEPRSGALDARRDAQLPKPDPPSVVRSSITPDTDQQCHQHPEPTRRSTFEIEELLEQCVGAWRDFCHRIGLHE